MPASQFRGIGLLKACRTIARQKGSRRISRKLSTFILKNTSSQSSFKGTQIHHQAVKTRFPFQGWKRGRWHSLTKSLESRNLATGTAGELRGEISQQEWGQVTGGGRGIPGMFFSFFLGGPAWLSWFSGFSGHSQDWKPNMGVQIVS